MSIFMVLEILRNFLFICKVSFYFKEFVYWLFQEFPRGPKYAHRIRNYFISLGICFEYLNVTIYQSITNSCDN